jgi:hypothetical protein
MINVGGKGLKFIISDFKILKLHYVRSKFVISQILLTNFILKCGYIIKSMNNIQIKLIFKKENE